MDEVTKEIKEIEDEIGENQLMKSNNVEEPLAIKSRFQLFDRNN
ncbi:MAG TPA: hypothetical protein VNV85_08830 [Puia sp.]|jgi:hypothetical protein|nr:hypothetical protein [Puia sp.]